MLLYPVKLVKVLKVGAQRVKDLTCPVALEAAHDLGLRQSLLRAPLNEGTRARATAQCAAARPPPGAGPGWRPDRHSDAVDASESARSMQGSVPRRRDGQRRPQRQHDALAALHKRMASVTPAPVSYTHLRAHET